MKTLNHLFRNLIFLIVIGISLTFVSCEDDDKGIVLEEGEVTVQQTELDSLRNLVQAMVASNEQISQYISTFDTLDFVVFTQQEWARMHESHHENVVVHWPDGHTTEGIEIHTQDLKNLFVYAPDTRITEHPIKFGAGNMTAVTGIFEGTFTEPMPWGDGFVQPTGKAFKIPMCTIAIWGEDGTIIEEYLFWDNLTYLTQIGLN